jgi:hypothetical protein
MERISLTIPKRFQMCFDYAMKWVAEESDFKKHIKERIDVDKRLAKNRIKAAKIRYMINYYVRDKIEKRKKNEEKIKENPQKDIAHDTSGQI